MTDPKLFNVISKYKTGLIYHYSPKMNLSLTGVKSILEVSQKLNLPVLFLMDKEARAEMPLAKKLLSEMKIDIGEILLSHSFELYMRRAYIHYPNLIFFKNGAILDDFFPGLSSSSDYEVLIKTRLLK